MARCPPETELEAGQAPAPARAWLDWLRTAGEDRAAERYKRNTYSTIARGTVLCAASDRSEALCQIGAALATGNRAVTTGGVLYPLEWLVEERSVSTNTAAVGGNASLMMIG